MTDDEQLIALRRFAARALPLLDCMAGEGIEMIGFDDPMTIVNETLSDLGLVADEDVGEALKVLGVKP